MIIPEEFDDIRPYTDEEMPEQMSKLLEDEEFIQTLRYIYADIPIEKVIETIRKCRNAYEFQSVCVYPVIQQLLGKVSEGLEGDFTSVADLNTNPHTFVSNHRDIVLDSALLDTLLIDNGANTAEIAIGDNLLIKPWIRQFVRINKSFIVQRSLSPRLLLMASAKMSRYMHFAVSEKKENIWIAQREGRAKDSNDRTQESVLKMMAIGGTGNIIDRLKNLNIVPLTLSYEYDPCDYLKAKEFQMKRDIPGFKKSKQDDLDNMRIGIFGRKGHIHFHVAPCINDWLDTLDPDTPKNELMSTIAHHIDHQIHLGYKLYPANYVAADMLLDATTYADRYTEEEAETFKKYLNERLSMIELPEPDTSFLRERLLTMYANPTFNKAAAEKEK